MGSSYDAVMEYMEDELRKDRGVKNKTLFAGAREIDESVGELTLQQFHAKYRLPATRRIAPPPQRERQPKADPAPAGVTAVMEFVVRTLEANPGVSNADLFAGACEIDSSVADLSARQFHARYPLQVKARLARASAAEPEAPPAREVPPPARETTSVDAPPPAGDPVAIRGLLLDLAKELVNAESQAETIEVVARLDDYVAEIMKAAQG